MTNECVKCDKPMPADATSDGWVECSCSAHPGWYCDSHSPGNECFDDEECDCCNPGWDEGHHIVYGEWKEYDDDGVCSGSYNDEFTEFKSKEEALLEYNRLIKNNGDKNYDFIYLDYIDEDEDQDNVECWVKDETKDE